MTIYFDMDGTIADLYNVNNWLAALRGENSTPYEIAKPLVNFRQLAPLLNAVRRKGYKIGIISWGSKGASRQFDKAIECSKIKWLRRHLPSVTWDTIEICHYGTPKEIFKKSEHDILFDDVEQIRKDWGNNGLPPEKILETLRQLL